MIYQKSSVIERPLEDVFLFCSSKEGFLQHFPYKTEWISGADRWTKPGELLSFTFKFGLRKIDYVAEITDFKDGRYFIDVMKKGPYKYFIHEHHFEQDGHRTIYKDVIRFSLGCSALIDIIIGLPITALTFRRRHKLMKRALDN